MAPDTDSSVTLRFAVPDDAERLHALIVALAVYEKEPDAVEATPASLRAQMEQARPPFECLIAERDGAGIGIALFFHNYSTWTGRRGLYLEDLFVVPEARGAGVGLRLLRRLAQIAVERECGRFEWAVLDWNTPAREFYEALGARPMPSWIVHRLTGPPLVALAAKS